MKRKIIVAGIIVIVVVAVSAVWAYLNYLDYLSKTMHETERWAVITDLKGDIMAVESANSIVWSTFESLHQNQTEMWIGGIIEEYDNKWGFRFKPDTIIVARFTVEGAQSNIQGISGDLNYWMNVWAKETYVWAKVSEIHK
jgi:hypothetical protein